MALLLAVSYRTYSCRFVAPQLVQLRSRGGGRILYFTDFYKPETKALITKTFDSRTITLLTELSDQVHGVHWTLEELFDFKFCLRTVHSAGCGRLGEKHFTCLSNIFGALLFLSQTCFSSRKIQLRS